MADKSIINRLKGTHRALSQGFSEGPKLIELGVSKLLGLVFCANLAQIFFVFFFWLRSSRQMECSNRFFAQIFGAQIFAPIFAPIFGAQIFAPIFAQIFGAQIFVPIFAPIFAPIFS